jgi:hypothetical protein
MTHVKLLDFLQNRMSMSHIYQPLLIRTLVEAGGAATLRQLAHAFVAQDESQLRFYERRIREMPVPVLLKRGVIKREGELVRLNAGHLDFVQKARIKRICEDRLQRFVQKRGLGLWNYRLLDADPVPDSLRYQVLAASGGRCALCGATKRERPLDVDHIVPRSRGGKTELANLQVLCSTCNRTKGNRDATDFRVDAVINHDPSCAFCAEKVQASAYASNGSVIAIPDAYPVTPRHTVVIPRRHVPDFFAMTSAEHEDAEDLLRYLRNKIQSEDARVTGFIGSCINNA